MPLPRTTMTRASLRAAETGKATSSETRKPGRVEHFDQAGEPRRAQPRRQRRRRIACAGDAQQMIDLGERQRLRQRALALWAFEHGGGIVGALAFRIEEAVELADRREPPRHRRHPQAAPRQLAEIAAQIVGARLGDGAAGVFEIIRKIFKIAAIGGERVAAGAAFRRQHVEIERDRAARRNVAPSRLDLRGPIVRAMAVDVLSDP